MFIYSGVLNGSLSRSWLPLRSNVYGLAHLVHSEAFMTHLTFSHFLTQAFPLRLQWHGLTKDTFAFPKRKWRLLPFTPTSFQIFLDLIVKLVIRIKGPCP